MDHPAIDRLRQARGFLSLREVLELAEGNDILDPGSLLISRGVRLGTGNLFYPNVVLQCQSGGTIEVGRRNVFFPGFLALADHGSIRIGDGNQFGDGNVSLKANVAGARIVVEDAGRYMNGVTVLGSTFLGTGTQLLGGPLAVQDCHLGAGGNHAETEPDRRRAVLKGYGLARGLRLAHGEVVNGRGELSQGMVQRQLDYHPLRV